MPETADHDGRYTQSGEPTEVPAVAVPDSARDHVGHGYYRKCTWCHRPAYATKQEWIFDGEFWSGGPVCEVCARKRAPHERVVGPGGEVLLTTRDPRVPPDGKRRRRRKPPPSA
jgi:hypothetical protein